MNAARVVDPSGYLPLLYVRQCSALCCFNNHTFGTFVQYIRCKYISNFPSDKKAIPSLQRRTNVSSFLLKVRY